MVCLCLRLCVLCVRVLCGSVVFFVVACACCECAYVFVRMCKCA